MDAREYLARKGVDGERDRERPNTLEEKAWARAREAGDHRPRAGTPHDWEEWERFHGDLADDADSIDQKIDHDAHRRALDHESPASREKAVVGSYTPPSDNEAPDGHSQSAPGESPDETPGDTPEEPPWLRLMLKILAVFMPPLAVGLAGYSSRRVLVALALTLLGWVPGVVYAWRGLANT